MLWCGAVAAASAQRVTLPLDGIWQIEDSVSAADKPARFGHTVPVPGLAHSSQPPFPDVDAFDSLFALRNKVEAGQLPKSVLQTPGISRRSCNYFWYRKTFRVSTRKAVAILTINKAQFGTAVWLNGRHIGDHAGCFTSSSFDLTLAMNWSGDNELVVRVGAHPLVLPPAVPAGTDYEKVKWTPGIYDSVSIALADNPVIETVQVAPRSQSNEILMETNLRNYGGPTSATLAYTVRTWKPGVPVATAPPLRVRLEAGESKTVRQTIPIPKARLWSPENPFLYVLEASTGGDSVSTRFGMREFRFDTGTRRDDKSREVKGALRVSVLKRGAEEIVSCDRGFDVPAFGQHTLLVPLSAPAAPGQYLLRATARGEALGDDGPTVSRRMLNVVRRPAENPSAPK